MNVQRTREPEYRGDSDVAIRALNAADIVPVQAGELRQFLLDETALAADALNFTP